LPIVFNGADAMTLTAQNGSDEIMIYVRQSIPMDIIEGSIIVRSTVAVDILPILLYIVVLRNGDG
jgi:hypothetical protein